MHRKLFAILMSVLALASCGTFTTLGDTDGEIQRELVGYRVPCDSIPRVYSGVVYDYCLISAPPGKNDGVIGFGPMGYPDLVSSAIADTLALPYTIYRQVTVGSLEIK